MRVKYRSQKSGPVAQLGARLNGIEKAEGSNPSRSTITEYDTTRVGVVGHLPASRERECEPDKAPAERRPDRTRLPLHEEQVLPVNALPQPAAGVPVIAKPSDLRGSLEPADKQGGTAESPSSLRQGDFLFNRCGKDAWNVIDHARFNLEPPRRTGHVCSACCRGWSRLTPIG